MKVPKAPGPDGLPNWLLRDFSCHLAGPVCAIYNASVREGFVPLRWKEANVVPVPKVQPPRAVESDLIIIIIIKTFITRKFAEAANARSVDSTEEKRLQSLFEDVQRDVR